MARAQKTASIISDFSRRPTSSCTSSYLDAKGDPPDHIDCTPVEVMGAFLWFMWVKQNFSASFPHLFKPASGDGDYDMTEAMNAQIRALTGGDITKEGQIKDSDVWRALTELDAKAREADELDKRLKQKS